MGRRPLCQKVQHHDFNEDGRTDRASLQRVTRLCVRSCFSLIVFGEVPTAGLVLADLGQEVAHLAGGDLLDATEGGEDARSLVGEEERLVGAVATNLLECV